MSVTIIKDLERAVREARDVRTVGSLADDVKAVTYRHPDSAEISYPKIVNNGPIGTLNPGSGLTIGIVGAGPAGIVALYELGKLATPERNIQVTIFESDADNFLVPSASGQSKLITRRRAGRVSSYRAANATIYEIGAMRFPTIAGLTWHYAKEVLGPDGQCNQFPNPGTVPTEFVFGSQYDQYHGSVWLNMSSPTKKVKELVLKGLYGVPYPGLEDLPVIYRIGTRTGLEVNELLVNPAATDTELQEFTADWNTFIAEHDGTSLEGAVRRILTEYHTLGALPPVQGLTGTQLISWCVELFGRFGFGTGGFKPLFNISLVEMMRLLLWDYSNEYTFPSAQVPGNVEFIQQIYDAARLNTNLTVDIVNARVSDVFTFGSIHSAGIAYYQPIWPKTVEFAYFDYGILALPHDAAALPVARIGTGSPLINNPIGDIGASKVPSSGTLQRPALLLSTNPNANAINARMISAIGTLHMTRSAKIFATITEANATGAGVPTFNDGKISAIISDSGLAATYMVPSTIDPINYRSFLVSYLWDDDSTKLQNTLANWPENDSNDSPTGNTMFDAMINRAYRVDPASSELQAPKWWLSATLTSVENVDKVSYDWSTYTTAGGWKLDNTGDTYQSSLCFRFHTHAYLEATSPDAPNPDCRFFLAGDSFSHLGGWLEGAFMSAINAVAGITLAANGGRSAISTLNPEAQKLFTKLTPILPMN